MLPYKYQVTNGYRIVEGEVRVRIRQSSSGDSFLFLLVKLSLDQTE